MDDTTYCNSATALFCFDQYNDFIEKGSKMRPALSDGSKLVNLDVNRGRRPGHAHKARITSTRGARGSTWLFSVGHEWET